MTATDFNGIASPEYQGVRRERHVTDRTEVIQMKYFCIIIIIIIQMK